MNGPFSQDNLNETSDTSRRRRRRDPKKLLAIAAAARRVMTARGVRLTQVADVARAAKVATGTVYLYARDKEALIELALRDAASAPLDASEATLEPDADGFERLVRDVVEARFTWPVLEAALIGTPSFDTLEAIFSETYDLAERWCGLIALLDRCADEVPLLAQAWHEGKRRAYFEAVTACLEHLRAHQIIRDDVDVAMAGRGLCEMIVWTAQKRSGDPEPPPCDDQTARATAIALAVAALAWRPPAAVSAPVA